MIRGVRTSIALALAVAILTPASALADEASNTASNDTNDDVIETVVTQQKDDEVALGEQGDDQEPMLDSDTADAENADNPVVDPTQDCELGDEDDLDAGAEEPHDGITVSDDSMPQTQAAESTEPVEDEPTETAEEEEADVPTGHFEKPGDGYTYYRDETGKLAKWSRTIDGKLYYFDGAGRMFTGWLTWNDDKTRSYFDPTKGGAAATGFKKDGGATYYLNPKSYRTVRWSQTINGKEYYFNGACKMATGIVTWARDGSTALFGSNGAKVTSGWATMGGNRYYARNGSLVRYRQKIDNEEYYFYSSYAMHKGWIKWPKTGTWSYYDIKTGIKDESLENKWLLVMQDHIAQVAEHFASHDAHGYSQPNRGAGGSEAIELKDGTQVTISKADVDCSEMVRQCVNAVLGYNVIKYMDTRCEDSLLRAKGFVRMAFNANSVQRGDVLWRYGHTAVALGDNKQAEAFCDENHDIYGPIRGDNNGAEVAVNPLRTTGYWTYIYRFV
jgi:glucan-binding YG repeat protein